MSDVTYLDRVRGCLLGGALGDALGAPIEFLSLGEIRARFGSGGLRHLERAYGRVGAITDDTQMTLFTAEGLIRAWVRGEARGLCDPAAIVHHAYLRWLHTQGEPWRESAGGAGEKEPDGWLVKEKWLHARRAPGRTCMSALRAASGFGTPARNDSKGCGGVMRVAPVGLLPHAGTGGEREIEGIFRLGVETAALTHGHASGQLPAGVLAAAIFSIVREGRPLDPALDAATGILRGWPHHGETLRALERARALAARGGVTPERLESLGGGWIAEEALAIAVAAALAHPEPEAVWEALVLAANHSGDSDSTAAIAGNLLGALHGVAALPAEPLAELEGRDAIARLADDFAAEMEGTRPRYGTSFSVSRADGTPLAEPVPPAAGFEAWWERYPGW